VFFKVEKVDSGFGNHKIIMPREISCSILVFENITLAKNIILIH
jgi:hypothetical protein